MNGIIQRVFLWKSLFLLILVAFSGVSSVWAQTGKITGRVIDAETGEPLPGVNVYIEGTTLGSTTDANGEYVIIGVRPGVYTVIASMVGYARERKEGVRVSVDLTTRVDFALRPEVIMGEEVVVVAEVPTVRKDLTSAEVRVSAETIDKLPIQEVSDVLSTKAGIVTTGSGIHIRGGRSKEVAYYVDGIRVSDSYDGSITVQIEADAIQELQVIAGTYNAEYGQAMSGIINVVTKEGGAQFRGNVEAYSGSYVTGGGTADYIRGTNVEKYLKEGIQYKGVDPYGFLPLRPTHYQNVQVSLEGPLLGEKLAFYTLGRYFRNTGWLYGARLFNYDGTPGDSSLVPMNPYRRLSGHGNVRWRVTNTQTLKLIWLASAATGKNYDHAWRWAPDGRPRYYDEGYNISLKWTDMLSSTAFYNLIVGHNKKLYKSYVYEDPNDPRYVVGGRFIIAPPDSVPTGAGRFLRGGVDLNRFRRITRSYVAKGDLTIQLGKHHLVKTGFEGQLDDYFLRSYSFILNEEGGLSIPDPTSSRYLELKHARPISLSAYVQDKMEFESFIVNAGIRVDYFHSRGKLPADPEDPNIYNPFKVENRYFDLNGNGLIDPEEQTPENEKTVADREAYWWKRATPKIQLSPRLGIAYPITAQGVIHFSYGHFFQIPTAEFLFANPGYKVTISTGIYGPYGNPDLKAQKTVMYELGLQQGLGESMVLDITGFYRDVRNWVSTSTPIKTAQPGVSYVMYVNRDYSNVRGITISLSKRFSHNYGFDIDYTFQVAEGSNSSPEEEFFARLNNQQPTIALLPLDWDQRHTLNVSFYMSRQNWGFSTISRFGSGFPYTPFIGQAQTVGQNVTTNFPRNSRRKPPSFRTDVYAYYDLKVGHIRPRLFLQVYNVFDIRNAVNVFADTGRPDVTLEQRRVGSYDPGYYVRPDFYDEPRRIHLGLQLNF